MARLCLGLVSRNDRRLSLARAPHEGREPDELGTRRAGSGLAFGVTVGAGLFFVVYAILWALGAVRFEGLGGLSGLAPALAIAIASAVGEEIVFRGVAFRLLEGSFGTAIALIASGAAFGLLHAGNPGATWVSSLAVALEAGVSLGLAYAATRTLWLPIGLHFGWNFTEGGIFGAPLITGGDFGPEASIVTMVVFLAASAALAWIAIRNGNWRRVRARLIVPAAP